MKKLIYLIVLVLILGLVLSGCLLSNVGQVPTNEQSGITYLTKGGPTESEADHFDLYAGQDMLVGEVLVWDDGTQLCVKYQLSENAILDGWLIYETHWAVGDEPLDIPQKNGNPIPGKFPYGDDDLGGVKFYQECRTFTELSVDCLNEIVIAAHAVIEKTECEVTVEAGSDFFVSDIDTMVVAGNVGGAVYPENAVLAHKPGDANSPYLPVWDTNLIPHTFDAAAEWIWESYLVVHPILGDVVTFERQFEVPGIPAGGTLYVAADNGFAVELNGVPLGNYNLFQYPTLDGLTQPYVNTTDWWNVQQYDLAANLQQGPNTLTIIGVNEYMNPDDVDKVGNFQMIGDVYYNPGGVIFEFDVDWDEVEECTTYSETAWGAVDVGEEPFDGKNWATYFNYTVECPCEVSYPADGNVYIGYEDWLNGDFDYNDFGMYFNAVETYTGGCGVDAQLTSVLMTFTAQVYDSGMTHHIHIERPIVGGSQVTVTRIDRAAAGDETVTGTFAVVGDVVDIVLFDTKNYTWPSKLIDETVTVLIEVDNPSQNLKDTPVAPRDDLDPFMANYDPWEIGSLYGSLYHIEDEQLVTAVTSGAHPELLDTDLVGLTLPYILVVPSSDWVPPFEDSCISGPRSGGPDGPYAYFYDYYYDDSHSEWYNEVTDSFVGLGGLSW